MITNYKKNLEPILSIIAHPFLSWNPAILTFLSLLSAILFFIGIVTHLYWISSISVLGLVFDSLDGYVARAKNKTSAFGAFLDSTLDRVSDFFLIVSFGFGHLVSWELVVLVLFTSFFISYIQARGESVFNKTKPTGLMQRTERIVSLLLTFFLFLLFPTFHLFQLSLLDFGFMLIFIFNCITIFQRFIFIIGQGSTLS